MIRINQLKLPVEHTAEQLAGRIARALKIKDRDSFSYEIIRRSVDARKKPSIYYIYTVEVDIFCATDKKAGDNPDNKNTAQREQKLVERLNDPQITVGQRRDYRFPYKCKQNDQRPVIIGMGPAGLFCGYMLAVNGFRPIILERGEAVEERERTVEQFWRDGIVNRESNVLFGEGGAGTFSDGKLNTLIKDKEGRCRAILSLLIEAGAPDSIAYDSKPHIGTDRLKRMVVYLRKAIIAAGGEVRFGQKVTGLMTGQVAGRERVVGVEINGQERLATAQVVLAIGHSARDTIEVLYERGLPMEAKAFAVGLRVEHPQSLIDRSQYGIEAHEILAAADYKVVSKGGQPSVYSFCMCPGGYVVNASSEEGRLAINGMSYSDRKGPNANSAIVVTIAPSEYGDGSPLSGIAFQRQLEERAFVAGNGKVPVEYYGEYKRAVLGDGQRPGAHDGQAAGRPAICGGSDGQPVICGKHDAQPAIKGAWCFGPVHEILPTALNQALVRGMTEFGRMIKGFDDEGVLVSGVESRTSSPVRIMRDEGLQAAIEGVYPCGEGAGYAGGIMSAAADGIKVAEAVAAFISKE